MSIKKKLKKLLDSKDMSQGNLAEAIGVSNMTISNIKNGATKSYQTRIKITEFFGVDSNYFEDDYVLEELNDEKHLEEIEQLKELLDVKDKYLKLLEETNEMLRKKLEESKA